jgi:RNA polymerase sigma-70 factor, ECF subfamily
VEIELVERARSGDRMAFAEIVVIVGDRLYGLAYRVVRDTQVAQDAVQQALLDAWRDLPSLRDANRFEAWLTRLVLRSCYEEVGRQRRFTARMRWLHVDEPSRPDGSLALDERDALERGIRTLSVEHRAVLALHFYLDLPLVAIADRLDIPVGTARSRLHYAIKSLRAALEADERQAGSRRSSA